MVNLPLPWFRALSIWRGKAGSEKQVAFVWVMSSRSTGQSACLPALVLSALRGCLGFSLSTGMQQGWEGDGGRGDCTPTDSSNSTWQKKTRLLLKLISSEAMQSKPSITPGWFNQLPVKRGLGLLCYCTNTVITTPACNKISFQWIRKHILSSITNSQFIGPETSNIF